MNYLRALFEGVGALFTKDKISQTIIGVVVCLVVVGAGVGFWLARKK